MSDPRPWMTALEMQFAALNNARRMIATGAASGSIADRVDHDAVRLLPSAVPFAWSRDVTKAVWLASRTIPEDAIIAPDVLPEGIQTAWWWFDDPLPIPMEHGENIEGCDTTTIHGLILHVALEQRALLVIDVRMSDMGPMTPGFSGFQIGSTLGGIVRGKRVSPFDRAPLDPSKRALSLVRFLLAASTWLNQRILSIGSGHIERHRRKQIARENNVPPPTDVRVIQLRRLESEPHGQAAGAEAVEWSCRWIVNGHWRNQPYKDSTKLIYIMPFVKGPADKPLKVPTHTVYQVSR